jgi:putative addiction module CopG family antidote
MNITLSPETQRLLDAQLKSGEYPSVDALVRTALEQLQSESAGDLDETILAAIEEGIAQSDRGESTPWEQARADLAKKLNVK